MGLEQLRMPHGGDIYEATHFETVRNHSRDYSTTLPETNGFPVKKKEIHLPTINFQGLC